jgi:hypothetical protein
MLLNKKVASILAAIIVLVAVISFWSFGQAIYHSGYRSGYQDGYIYAHLGADISFNATEAQAFGNVKGNMTVYNADPIFTGDRVLQWISMRNSSSASWDPPQKSMEYLCFWSGQGDEGEWQAVISIYNVPNSATEFVVEVSRFTWHQIQVTYNGTLMADFPQVKNDTTSLGYTTFRIHV